jgi:hypothetical protein
MLASAASIKMKEDLYEREQATCRFQKLDSCVPVMQSAQDCMGDDVPEALDRAPVRRILSERNMRTPPIIIGGEFRKDPPQVLCVPNI